MQPATLCYPLRGEEVLLIEKKRGLGAGKVVGPGGKVEPGETPTAAAVRETREETGLRVSDPEKVGEFTFVFGDEPRMFVHVFRATEFSGTPRETPEAVPGWFHVDELPYDEMWEDDRYWLPHLLAGEPFEGRFAFDADGEELLDRTVETGVSFSDRGPVQDI